MQALTDLRVEQAERLLQTARLTVLEAGLAAGFGSASAFTRACRRREGLSPARWRALTAAQRPCLAAVSIHSFATSSARRSASSRVGNRTAVGE